MHSAGLRRVCTVACVVALLIATPGSAQEVGLSATGPLWLAPPVDAPVARRFVAATPNWEPGHRGIDYAVAPGTLVRAAGAGRVRFAGDVAGSSAVTIEHYSGFETTYSILSEIMVDEGEYVTQGRWLGRAGSAHAEELGLHFAARLNGVYVDPLLYLGPLDVTGAIHLAPLVWRPSAELGRAGAIAFGQGGAGTHEAPCREPQSMRPTRVAPNDNVAIAIAGIGSKTAGGTAASMYEQGPELLGYRPRRVYRFSYRGSDAPNLHEPFERIDTHGDLTAAARKLRELLVRVGQRHPGRAVDILAHSQGGVVARTFLELQAETWDPDLPRIEHVITFASPHGGAPLAAAVQEVKDKAITGSLAMDGLSLWAQHGGPIPDPNSLAVRQQAPGSAFLEALGHEDALFGTRVLALAMPHDAVVPADRARWEGEQNRVVRPEGLNGHTAIVGSEATRGIVHAFLRDVDTCPGRWDSWGGVSGRILGWGESLLPDLYAKAEQRLIDRVTFVRGVGKVLQRVHRIIRTRGP